MKEPRPSDEPSTLKDWLWRLKRYEHGIFVREQIDGKSVTIALAHLRPEQWAHHVARWLEEGILPTRIREPEEMDL